MKEFYAKEKVYFKVTLRIPELKIAETKIFQRKEEALQQLQQWLAERKHT